MYFAVLTAEFEKSRRTGSKINLLSKKIRHTQRWKFQLNATYLINNPKIDGKQHFSHITESQMMWCIVFKKRWSQQNECSVAQSKLMSIEMEDEK